MSYYYNYYIGYKSPDGLIHPMGAYDNEGNIHPALSKSRSFASELHERFSSVPDEAVSDDLRKVFTYENWNGESVLQRLEFCELSDLPAGQFIKYGYYLIDDVQTYLETEDSYDIFYDHLDPLIYEAMKTNEILFGKPDPKFDDEGGEFPNYTAGDYMFFAYPDWNSEECEAFLLRNIANIYDLALYDGEHEGCKLVILKTEG